MKKREKFSLYVEHTLYTLTHCVEIVKIDRVFRIVNKCVSIFKTQTNEILSTWFSYVVWISSDFMNFNFHIA